MPAISAKPFDFPHEGALSPAQTALLVIDMQHDYLSPQGYFAQMGYDPSPLRKIIPTVNAVVDAVRRAGGHVIWTAQGVRADLSDVTPFMRWKARRAGMEFAPGKGVLIQGSPGYQISTELRPRTDEPIIHKLASGAFTYTDLDNVLKSKGITHLLFAGCTTDVCVHSTLREANDRGYRCLLIDDACASGDPYAHQAAVYMTTVEDGVFGVVSNAAEVVRGFGACSGSSRT